MPTAEASQLQPAVDGATAVVEKVAKAVRKATTGIMQLGKKDGITVETSRFLTGEDYKNTAVARKDSVLSHMKIDAAKVKFIDGQTFGAVEKGTTKYMSFDENKKEESKVTQAPTKKAELAI